MHLAGLALLAAMAMGAQDPPGFVVPSSPDLTIRLRAQQAGSHQSTVTIRLKGARQVRERRTEFPGGSSSIVEIGQCDHRRMMLLSPEHKTYAYVPIGPPPGSTPPRGAVAVTSSHTVAGRDEIVIDAVDTGERRQMGGLTARHVVTTTKTTIGGAVPAPVRTRIQDGWYVDLPPVDCIERTGEMISFSLVSGGMAGVVSAPPHVTVRGRAKAGVALIETDRATGPEGKWEQTTELVEISTARLDAALFEVPPDYRAALPLSTGGFDLSRPDTVGNRLSLLWEGIRGLASRWWP